MKISAKNRRTLLNLVADLKRGQDFIMHKDTAIMRKHYLSSIDYFKSDFPDYSGEKWVKIEKQIGNDFVIALSAADRLERILRDES